MHRSGQDIEDGSGKNVVLRGFGLGGWMILEGFMLKTGSFAGPHDVIIQKITDAIGKLKCSNLALPKWYSIF